jgi:hypothetical protein
MVMCSRAAADQKLKSTRDGWFEGPESMSLVFSDSPEIRRLISYSTYGRSHGLWRLVSGRL